MLSTFTSSGRLDISPLADTVESISAAIAYAVGMENARIKVREMAGIVFLEGTAPSTKAVDRATEIATDIAGPCICNRIEPVA